MDISQLNKEQLVVALKERGVSPNHNTGEPKLRQMLAETMQQLGQDFTLGTTNQGGQDNQSQQRPAATQPREPIAYTINLVDDDSGNDVRGCANGQPFILQRGVDVKVSAVIFNAINDAKRIVYKRDKSGKIIDKGTLKHRFPFAVIEKHFPEQA